jgi:steroid delta-isomerase-like uncharacterized protein
MNSKVVVQKYIDAWNQHDPNAIIETFTSNGTYTDPVSGEVTGHAIGEYAARLFAGFPDLSFELTSQIESATGQSISAQWTMRGINTGMFMGMPPTGKSICVYGADFFVILDDKISSVQGYFDSKSTPQQLGLQVIVQPKVLGPVTFGYSVAMQNEKPIKPGAFSLTTFQARSDEEADQLRTYSRKIYAEVGNMSGFISMLTAGVGHRFYTASAWENSEHPKQLFQSRAHQEAMDSFYNSDFGAGGTFSVWVPARISPLMVRCISCKLLCHDYEKAEGKCTCGMELPTPPPYW